MSCFVMARRKGARPSRTRSRLSASLRPGRRKGVMPFIGSPRSFRSPRRRLAGRAGPWFRACRVRARSRAFRGGARRASDCAREAEGAIVPCVSQGFISRRREPGGEAACGCRFLLPHSSTDFLRTSPMQELVQKNANRTSCPDSAGARRPASSTARLWTRTRSAVIDGQGAVTVNNLARQTCRIWSRWPKPSSTPALPTRTQPSQTSTTPTSCPNPPPRPHTPRPRRGPPIPPNPLRLRTRARGASVHAV